MNREQYADMYNAALASDKAAAPPGRPPPPPRAGQTQTAPAGAPPAKSLPRPPPRIFVSTHPSSGASDADSGTIQSTRTSSAADGAADRKQAKERHLAAAREKQGDEALATQVAASAVVGELRGEDSVDPALALVSPPAAILPCPVAPSTGGRICA
jgi:hypothetical protein